ncbi:MAG: DUF6531 domain-containing protein, partial [Clostridia bacterium]
MENNTNLSVKARMNLFAQLEGEEDIHLRSESIKQYDMGAGRYQAVMYPEAVHYRESEDAIWEEIDNNLETAVDASGRAVLKNKKNALHVELADAADNGDLVTLKSDADMLSWRFEKAVDKVHASVKPGQQRKLEKLAERLGKQIAQLNATERQEDAQEKRLDYVGKTAEARYDEILPGVSVRYTLIGDKLKEDIILANKAALKNAVLILKGNMNCVLNEDQTITVQHKGANKPSFILEAPVAYDADGTDVPVSPVLEKSKGKNRLSYAIAEVDLDVAAYPITIDPVVHTTKAETNVQDMTLTQGATVTATGNGTGAAVLKIGVNASKENVALVRFLKLAKIKSSDTIISAVLRMAPKSGSSAKFTAAHEVLRSWSPKQISYDTFGVDDSTKVCPDELDYSDSATGAYMVFDLTNVYRKWYESDGTGGDKNYGVLLRKANRVSGTQYQEIHSSEASTSSNKPVFYVNYISHAGLEGWWQYESQSAGRAGTAHVDLFNGNVVVQHQDTEMNGNLSPVSLTHYYNSCLSSVPTTDVYRCGYGWTHSGLQRIYTKTLNSTDYYIWVDGDGTEHWFKNKGDGTESKDLEGMQLKLTRYAKTTSKPPRVEIVDKQHTKMTFQKRLGISKTGTWVDYWLLSVADAHGNKASYTYDMPADQNDSTAMRALEGKLLSIKDGADRTTSLLYTGNLLSSIAIPDATTNNTRTVYYTYEGGRLTDIRYGELGGTTAHTSYAYVSSTNLLSQVKNFDGLCVNICYEPASKYASTYIDGGAENQMRRATSLETVKMSGPSVIAYGAKQSFNYLHMCTEVTAADGTNDDSGKKLSYQFNDSGNVTCVMDELGFAKFTKFASAIENAASEESKLQRAVINRLRMPDFSAEWSATVSGSNAALVNTATRCLGLPSVAITKSNDVEARYSQNVSLEGGKSWSLSAYVKTIGFADGVGNVFLRVKNASTGAVLATSYPQKDLTPVEDDKDLPTDDWERLHVTFTTSAAIIIQVELVNATASGTAYFACPQLEEGAVANSFNLVSNGDFRLFTQHSTTPTRLMPTDWIPGGDLTNQALAQVMVPVNNPNDAACRAFPHALGGNLVRVPGAPDDGSACFYQDISVKGAKNDVFVLGGWANAKSAPNASTSDRGFRLTMKFYTGSDWQYGTNNDSKIPFNFEWVGWQYMSGACTAPAAYTKIRFYVVYMNNVNDASFTNVFVHKEQFGRSFAYDGKKNLLSVENLAGKKSGRTYDDYDNMTRYRRAGTPDEDAYKYRANYGDTVAQQKKHLLLSTRTPEQMRGIYTYDAKGNQLSAMVQKLNETPFIKTETAYNDTTYPNYVATKKDARGNVVTQDTNARTGTLTSVTDPTGTT